MLQVPLLAFIIYLIGTSYRFDSFLVGVFATILVYQLDGIVKDFRQGKLRIW